MEFQLQSAEGEQLFAVLANWIEKSPELASCVVKPMFLANSFKVKNEEGFVAALHGANILEESPCVLNQRFPTTLLKVQHAMEISLNKGNVEELIVALELSSNQSLLTEVLSWAVNNSKEIQESIKNVSSVDLAAVEVAEPEEIQDSANSVSSVDLAPVKVQKRKPLSEIISGMESPSHHGISWVREEKHCTALEVCSHKIIVGWDNGQIRIYDSSNLDFQTALNYGTNKSRVTCLQCTCTEIIAGYENGIIGVWNIQGGSLAQTLSVADGGCARHFPTCMRWRNSKLVVGTAHGRIHIWQKLNSCFTPLGSWDADESHIRGVDFTENYVVLEPCRRPESVKVHDFNGQKLRSISSRGGILQMAVHENHLLTCDRYGTLQIWEISTGECFKELKDHGILMFGFDSHNGVIVGGNRGEKVLMWNIQAALEGGSAELINLPHRRIECVPFDAIVDEIKVGQNFLVAMSGDREHQSKIFVTEFLS